METFEVKTASMMIDFSLEEIICLKIFEIPLLEFPQQAFQFCSSLVPNLRYIHYHSV